MTAKTWRGCVKLHEGCGGICQWVEAIGTPGVGYYGECRRCEASRLTIEDMLPIDGIDPETVRDVAIDRREQVTWNPGASWEENQRRIRDELGLPRQIDSGG